MRSFSVRFKSYFLPTLWLSGSCLTGTSAKMGIRSKKYSLPAVTVPVLVALTGWIADASDIRAINILLTERPSNSSIGWVVERLPDEWPRLESCERIESSSQSAESIEEKEFLIAELIDVIHDVAPLNYVGDLQKLDRDVSGLFDLALRFQEGGGYSNQVLAVAVKRRIIACIGHFVANSSKEVSFVKNLLLRVNFEEVDLAILRQLKIEEEGISVELSGDRRKNISMLIQTSDRERNRLGLPFAGGESKTEEFVKSGNVSLLAFENEDVYWYFHHCLVGFVDFTSRGGNIADIKDRPDLDGFVELMGGHEEMSKYSVKGLSDMLYPQRLVWFAETFSSDSEELRRFLRQ